MASHPTLQGKFGSQVVKEDGSWSEYGEEGDIVTLLWPEAQPGWLGTLPRSFNWGRESLKKETGNPTRSRRKNLEVAQEITHYQRRSRELSQSLFGIGQTIFLMNEHYLLSVFFSIRFPNKRNGLNLLNKNRMNFSLKNKTKKPLSLGLWLFLQCWGQSSGLPSCWASALISELHTRLGSVFLPSLTSCHERVQGQDLVLS